MMCVLGGGAFGRCGGVGDETSSHAEDAGQYRRCVKSGRRDRHKGWGKRCGWLEMRTQLGVAEACRMVGRQEVRRTKRTHEFQGMWNLREMHASRVTDVVDIVEAAELYGEGKEGEGREVHGTFMV